MEKFLKAVMALIFFLLILHVAKLTIVAVTTGSEGQSFPQVKYSEYPYTLSDGTPCVIVRSKTSTVSGITCNYKTGEF